MELAQLLNSRDSVLDITASDWDRLLLAASADYVLPALHSYIEIADLHAKVPAEVINVLVASAELNSERNRFILGEAVHAARLLNAIGIKPIALKGLAYLLAGVYPDPAERYLADIDLLLVRDQLAPAVDQLKRHGYFESESAQLLRFRHHYPSLQRDGMPPIEIHHRIGQGICARILTENDISLVSQPLTFQGATFLIPSATQLVTHLILHSQLAHPYSERIFPSLRALVDLIRLQDHFGNDIDWSAVGESFRRAGDSSTIKLHLRHANDILGFEILKSNKSSAFESFTPLETLRWYRRRLLNRRPGLRYFDPIYLVMSLFSRRLRLIPEILRQPSAWPEVARVLTQPDFYSNFFRL